MGQVLVDAKVECYAGYKGEETPRAVTIAGTRFEVLSVLSRQRALEKDGAQLREVWRCRLGDGRTVVVERISADAWRVSAPD
jgi:hypothetical protein